MRSSFLHLPKRCRCGELLCRRSKVRPARSFRIRCLRCRRARRKQRVCLLCKSTSRFQPQNQPGHRSVLKRSEVRLPPKDSAAFRFCCCALCLRCRTFKFRCFPCVFVCNAIILRLTAFRFGFCAIGLSRGSVVFGGNAQGFILLTRGFVRFAGRFCPHSFCLGGFSAVFGIHPGGFGQYSPLFGGSSAFFRCRAFCFGGISRGFALTRSLCNSDCGKNCGKRRCGGLAFDS